MLILGNLLVPGAETAIALASFNIGVETGQLAVILLALRIKSRKDPIPFGPALVIGTALVVLGGTGVYSWYLNLFRFGN